MDHQGPRGITDILERGQQRAMEGDTTKPIPDAVMIGQDNCAIIEHLDTPERQFRGGIKSSRKLPLNGSF
jgi:hypothetical protein